MASNGSEVFRIDRQEDDISDNQRQEVELNSQEELATDKEISKEVRSSEIRAVTMPEIAQMLVMKMKEMESRLGKSHNNKMEEIESRLEISHNNKM